LETWLRTFWFHKMLGNSWVAEWLVTCEEALGSIELVGQSVSQLINQSISYLLTFLLS
jgi:hypothetical protein